MQKYYEDQHQRAVNYAVGDKVLLSTADLSLPMYENKLKPRYIGPFVITTCVGPAAYRLDLPSNMRIHPVFHVSKLK